MTQTQLNGHVNGSSETEQTAVVIGAGFSGIRMLYELKKRGIKGTCFEAASGIGGVRKFLGIVQRDTH